MVMRSLKARDVMTRDVISACPDTPLDKIAGTLLGNRISAVPVIDAAGEPIGMISEGDLIGRDEGARDARRDWWLTLLAEGEALHPDFLATFACPTRQARDAMTHPVITVREDTDLGEVARLLTTHRIKRVPVLHDARVVGIVSRADLVRALAAEKSEARAQPPQSGGTRSVGGNEACWSDRVAGAEPISSPTRAEAEETGFAASDFRALIEHHKRKEIEHRQQAARLAAEQQRKRLAELIEHHISDDGWRNLLHRAREAAERGAKEFLLLRFPSQLCADGGRAVNAGEPDWPATLRGEAADLYMRWEHDLKARGFHLSARVLEFPDGVPGDTGLFLAWGA